MNNADKRGRERQGRVEINMPLTPGPLGGGAEVGFIQARDFFQGKFRSVWRRSWHGSVLAGHSSVEGGGEFLQARGC